MADIMPLLLQTSPIREQRAYTLPSVVQWIAAERWENGVLVTGDPCPEARFNDGTACIPSDGEPAGTLRDTSTGGALSEGTFLPLDVYAYRKCSAVGYTLDEVQDQAEAALLASEALSLETALWSGVGTIPGIGSAAAAEGGTDLRHAIAAAEAAAARFAHPGVLHMNTFTSSLALSDGALEVKGARLQTKMGTPVVASPAYGADRIVLTPALFGYRSDVLTYDTAQEIFDQRKNDMLVISERRYILAMDPCGEATAYLLTGI